jgi:hypothetical protein
MNEHFSPEQIDLAFRRLDDACHRFPVLIDCLDQASKAYRQDGHLDWFTVILDVMFAMDLHDAGLAPDWFGCDQ